MILLLNILFGLLAGWLTWYLSGKVGAPEPVAVILAVIAGVVVLLANLAAQVV